MMTRTMTRALLALCVLLGLMAGCKGALGVDTQMYACESSDECIEGFTCVPEPGASYYGVCRPTGGGGDVVEPDGGETVEPPPGYLCRPCGGDDDCGHADARCTLLPEGSFCTSPCASNDDCPSGYFCFEMLANDKRCVPALFNTCAPCLRDGHDCGDGWTCDQTLGNCQPAVAECGDCVHDADCGPGRRCYEIAPLDRRCVPACPGGRACPANSTCQVVPRGKGTPDARACVPGGQACCFGPGCHTCDCPKGSYCRPGAVEGEGLPPCVECLSDIHCPLTRPICDGTACIAPACFEPEPYPCAFDPGQCCACARDSHCLSGAGICDLGTGECLDTPVVCSCAPPYARCIVVNGNPTCVECQDNLDCGAGCQCDAWQHRCVDLSGGGFCGQGGGCSSCITDGDCAAAPGLELVCASGCCVDVQGRCDNVAAFCQSPSECVSLYDVLEDAGMGAMALPAGDPDGDGLLAPTGYCSCTRSPFCGDYEGGAPAMPRDFAPVCCSGGALCLEVVQVLNYLGGLDADVSPSYDGSQGICFNPGTIPFTAAP